MPTIRERITYWTRWQRLTTPQEESLRMKLGPTGLQDAEKVSTATLMFFPAGFLSLWTPNQTVLAFTMCMWIMSLVALYRNRRGHIEAARYWSLGGIHLAFYGLSFMSSIGLTGDIAPYVGVLFILSTVGCIVILPTQKHVYYVLVANYLCYACFHVFAQNSSMLASYLFLGYSYLGLLLFLLLHSESKIRHEAVMRKSQALAEMLYYKARADRLERQLHQAIGRHE